MASQQPYLQHHQNIAYPAMMPPYRPMTFNVGEQQSPMANPANPNVPSPRPATATATATIASGSGHHGLPQSSFRAPAHKHAHHLHSIPPREKSTRTLIIDHMLWVHGRTRFAQARAELGMTDRTGGPTSPNYIHRTRPESYEEEDEDGSEGEDAIVLRARAGVPQRRFNGDEDERLGNQNLSLARNLRLRAEGLEKVVISMLEQPPPVHPTSEEDSKAPHNTDPHRLPNGVRLRLALGTIINDLFARQEPPPPYRHTHPHAPNVAVTTPHDHSPSPMPTTSDLPQALTTLAPVSGAFSLPIQPPSPAVSPRGIQKSNYTDYQQTFTYNQPSSMHMPYPSMQQRQQSPILHSQPSFHTRLHPSSRTRSLYALGADPRTDHSIPSFRCPRHLQTGCEICVEAKSQSGRQTTGHTHSRARRTSGSFSTDKRGSGSWKSAPGGVGPGVGSITGWQDGIGVGSGLLRPSLRGSALRRKARDESDDLQAGSGNTKLSKLIPRFIRLSALVAAELGRESRGEETDESEDGDGGGTSAGAGRERSGSGSTTAPGGTASGTPGRNEYATPGGSTSSPILAPSSPTVRRAALQAQAQDREGMYEFALRPSLEWYMLLAGLLTRAVLEGYLTGGWKGVSAVQCLLLFGLGINENAGKKDDEQEHDESDEGGDEEFSGFDPDELPNLVEAIKILFPSLRDSSSGQKDKAEEEYEIEMLERLKRFYETPSSTPDCATHMEDLAWQYPAEPVERAAVRFCEAIAKWRGKPELETYKKKPTPRMDAPRTPGGSTAMTIESLVHSNPTSPVMANNTGVGGGARRGGQPSSSERMRRLKKPSIDVYFMQTQTFARRGSWMWSGGNSNKRQRDDDGGRPGSSKRMYPS